MDKVHEGSAAPIVFLSYAGTQRQEAYAIRAALERRGINVVIDASFEPGEAILINIGSAVTSDVVIALISSEYLDRKYTEIEVSAAIANDVKFLPLTLEGLDIAPTSLRGQNLWKVLRTRSYRRLALHDSSYDSLAGDIKNLARVDRPASTEVLIGPDEAGELHIALLYDWEDGNLIDDAVDQCLRAGVQVAYVGSFGAPAPHDLADELRTGILWTYAAQSNREVSDILMNTIVSDRGVVYVTQPNGPSAPDGASVLKLGQLSTAWSRPAILPTVRWTRDRPQLRAQIDESIRLNQGVPFHLIGDKFCASRESAAAAAAAYELAIHQLPRYDETRLQAVLGHAAACRFLGDWTRAASVLEKEPLPDSDVPYPGGALAVTAEKLSLAFELGLTNDMATRANAVLSGARATGEWPLIIAIHRLLGMICEERGEYRLARDHLDRAYHYAEDLLDTSSLADQITTNDARRVLNADCLRELAAVEWRAGEAQLARHHLDLANDVLESVRDNPAADYLLNVIAYQAGRVTYTFDHDYEAARSALQQSYEALQKYGNPVRLATVLESIVLLEMDFVRGHDASIAALRPTLEKVRRIREARGHDYVIARTTRALGDLELALGNYSRANHLYTEAALEFNRLGKNPETATTLRYLSRCQFQLGDTDSAIQYLDEALEQLQEPDHHGTMAEIRSERARLRHRPLRHDQLTNEIEMTEIGEYAVHDWIASGLINRANIDVGQVVGVGDDAAVMRLGPDEDLVVTTDSVPPSMLTDGSQIAAAFAARFAVVACLADVIAMGGEPLAVLLNLHLRRATSASWTRFFLERAAEEAAEYGAVVAGGDLRERDQIALTVTGVGSAKKGHAITRNGAKVGDLIALTLSSAPGREFTGLGTRWAIELTRHLSRAESILIDPIARRDASFNDLGLPHQIMRAISESQLATSAIDTSDGLLACAELIGKASGVGIEFSAEDISKLIDPDVTQLAKRLGIAPFMFAFSAGYDWEVLLTIPKPRADELRNLGDLSAKSTFQNVAVIGRVVERGTWATEAALIALGDNRTVPLPFFTGEKFLPQPHLPPARGWLDFAKESTRRIPDEVSGMDSA